MLANIVAQHSLVFDTCAFCFAPELSALENRAHDLQQLLRAGAGGNHRFKIGK
jgi:hypothetical protein